MRMMKLVVVENKYKKANANPVQDTHTFLGSACASGKLNERNEKVLFSVRNELLISLNKGI